MAALNRLVALGNQLVDIHIRLREQLAALREGQQPIHESQQPTRAEQQSTRESKQPRHEGQQPKQESQQPTSAGQQPARDLADHCAGFCEALTRHHESEDTSAFALIEADFPELAPVLDELRRDHVLIADALRRLRTATTALELDTLAALLETHFTYEERKLVAALNKLDPRLGAEILGG